MIQHIRSGASTRRRGRRFAKRPIAWLAVVAILLRLGLPAGSSLTQSPGIAAELGEHALCLAAAEQAPAKNRGGEAPARPADHGDHDGLGCCLWHAAAAAAIMPAGLAVARTDYDRRIATTAPAPLELPARYDGSAQARAPPSPI